MNEQSNWDQEWEQVRDLPLEERLLKLKEAQMRLTVQLEQEARPWRG